MTSQMESTTALNLNKFSHFISSLKLNTIECTDSHPTEHQLTECPLPTVPPVMQLLLRATAHPLLPTTILPNSNKAP
jgi:hypothetical protein